MSSEDLMDEHKALNKIYDGKKQIDNKAYLVYVLYVMAKSMTRFGSRKPQGVQAPNFTRRFFCDRVSKLAGYAWEPLGSPESLRPVCQPHIARLFLFGSMEGGSFKPLLKEIRHAKID